jgi:serine/threonine protein kinase
VSADSNPGLPGLPARIAEYRLIGQIGRGRLAVVCLAEDERARRSVAFKLFTPALGQNPAFRTRFLRESEAAATIGHPSIVPVYEVGAVGDSLFVAMGYVQGGSAGALADRGGRLAAAQVWSILAQAASALDAAHEHGLVHGDVKPANILLESGADAGHVYLSDFGLAAVPPDIQLPGAPSYDYMAPEQAAGHEPDRRADLYSLACAGYALLCGVPPFGRDQGAAGRYAQMYAHPPTVTALRPDLPAAVDLVLATALAKDPAERYPSCAKFAEALRTALGVSGGQPPSAVRPPSAGQRPSTGQMPAYQPTQQIPGLGASRGRPPWELQPSAAPASDSFPEFAGLYREPHRTAAGPGGPLPGPAGSHQDPAGISHTAVYDGPPGGYGGPGQHGPEAGQHGVNKAVLAATALVVVVIGVVAGVALSGNPSGSSPKAPPSTVSTSSAEASGQAAAINGLLSSSASVRQSLSSLVGQILQCTNVSSAVSQLSGVVGQRRTEVSQASSLSASALPNGAAVKSSLLVALRDSLTADQDYLTWAQQKSSGCKPGNSPNGPYETAIGADSQAVTAKGSFVGIWNPVASRYGLPQESANSF